MFAPSLRHRWSSRNHTAPIKDFAGMKAWADGDSEFLLFDLEADPSETKDLAAEMPDVVANLSARMDEVDLGTRISNVGAQGSNLK